MHFLILWDFGHIYVRIANLMIFTYVERTCACLSCTDLYRVPYYKNSQDLLWT
jgi:hypothetical protein